MADQPWRPDKDDQRDGISDPLESRVKKNNDGVSVRRHRCVQVSSCNISHKFRDALVVQLSGVLAEHASQVSTLDLDAR